MNLQKRESVAYYWLSRQFAFLKGAVVSPTMRSTPQMDALEWTERNMSRLLERAQAFVRTGDIAYLTGKDQSCTDADGHAVEDGEWTLCGKTPTFPCESGLVKVECRNCKRILKRAIR